MFIDNKIILLGYMGSGKSTIGKHLAEHLALPFEDLDAYISKKEGKKIPELFTEKGEIYFRKKEQYYLEELLCSPTNRVIALGGGTPCYGKAMELIKEASPYVYYLQLPAKELAKRLLPEKSHRPLIAHLSDEDLEEFIHKHLFERNPFYWQAHFSIPCQGLCEEEICKKIIETIK